MRSISFSPTLRLDRAAGQQVLGAVDLRRLGQDRGAAMAHQQVGRGAERRVGGDAGIAVGAAALQAERQVLGGDGLALDLVGLGQHRLHALHAFLDGGAGAAGALDGHVLEGVGRLDAVGFQQEADLRRLAAEADQEHAGEVRMAQVAPQRCAAGRRSPRPWSPCRSRCRAPARRRRRRWDSRPARRSRTRRRRASRRWPSSSPWSARR